MLKNALAVVAVMAVLGAPAASGNAGFERGEAKTNQFWWPDQLNLEPLRQHARTSNPYGADYDYAAAFATLDLDAVKADIVEVMTNSQDWWPADWGNYGPFFIRLAWHSAGTYRLGDGRGGSDGGQMRFDPLNSWPDNGNLDKARRLLWPLKQKYGSKLSWADLMILSGTVAMESMGFKTLGFAGGRTDDWEPDLVYWGPETAFLTSDRHTGDRELEKPLAATEMGLIYVNPVGPDGKPDPLLAAHDIRETFGRMGMDDAETVALIAGGHTFGKTHGARPEDCIGAAPGGAAIEEQGLGWKNSCGKGNAEDTTTSGLEGAWTQAPTQWSMLYLDNLMKYTWKVTTSPAGAIQWIPFDETTYNSVPDAHVAGKFHAPIMLTTDLSLKFDPEYRKVTERFLANPAEFEDAFARAWFKLTHRDMGPRSRYLGAHVPDLVMTWQDPLPVADYAPITDTDVADLKAAILKSGAKVADLVKAAWASASSYRASDHRGGANGARVRLAPQKDWAANDPKTLAKTLSRLEKVQATFNKAAGDGKKVSLADLIILGGAAAIEKAAADAGLTVTVPFTPGRVDASDEQTDAASFAYLEPKADAFRNYYSDAAYRSPTGMLVDKANLLGLTVPEMTVLLGGMRVLGANAGGSKHGVFTDAPGTLTNDFFVNLLDNGTRWEKDAKEDGVYVGYDRASGKKVWSGTSADLIFGSSSELRAVAEFYAYSDSKDQFVSDFVDVWVKVMNNDR